MDAALSGVPAIMPMTGSPKTIDEHISLIMGRLSKEGNVSLVNDEAVFGEIKSKASLFRYIIPSGERKYIRSTGQASALENEAGSSIVEDAHRLAEQSAIEQARNVGANYLLIKRKDIVQVGNSVSVVLEGLPALIFGESELCQLKEINNVTNDYSGLAKFSPERFIQAFESANEEKKKDMLKAIMPMVKEDSLPKEVSQALKSQKHYGIVKEIVLDHFRDELLEEKEKK
jgi:hypothetical protein